MGQNDLKEKKVFLDGRWTRLLRSGKMEIQLTFLEGVNSIVIKGKDKAFMTTKDSVIFNRDMFEQIIVALVKNGHIDYKVLEGILEEIHTV